MLERFWSKVDKRGPEDCWLWLASTTWAGYGRFQLSWKPRIRVIAHRFTYEMANGPIPDGLEIDHLCRNRKCVNPTHLRVVTHRENTLCGQSFSAINASKIYCIRGHPLFGENLYIHPGGQRVCRICRGASQKRYELKKRGE